MNNYNPGPKNGVVCRVVNPAMYLETTGTAGGDTGVSPLQRSGKGGGVITLIACRKNGIPTKEG